MVSEAAETEAAPEIVVADVIEPEALIEVVLEKIAGPNVVMPLSEPETLLTVKSNVPDMFDEALKVPVTSIVFAT